MIRSPVEQEQRRREQTAAEQEQRHREERRRGELATAEQEQRPAHREQLTGAPKQRRREKVRGLLCRVWSVFILWLQARGMAPKRTLMNLFEEENEDVPQANIEWQKGKQRQLKRPRLSDEGSISQGRKKASFYHSRQPTCER